MSKTTNKLANTSLRDVFNGISKGVTKTVNTVVDTTPKDIIDAGQTAVKNVKTSFQNKIKSLRQARKTAKAVVGGLALLGSGLSTDDDVE